MKEIDARGLACPQPVVLLKKALDDGADEVAVIVDNEAARENVSRMALSSGCSFTIAEATDGCWIVEAKRLEGAAATPGGVAAEPELVACQPAVEPSGGLVVFIGSDEVGRGDSELGEILMKAFVNALPEQDETPATIAFMNAGVKLACADSPVLDSLRLLAEREARIIVCGTCLDFFRLKDNLAVGVVSNMYEIQDAMLKAARLVTI